MDVQQDWSGKSIAVIGLGVSNLALIRFLKQKGARLSGRDLKTAQEFGDQFAELKSLAVDLVLGPDYLLDLEEYDLIMVSPGVPKDLPELKEAKKQGRLSSEIDLVFHQSPSPIYGITGSNGKTTTTTLIGEMLKASDISVQIGGNIGNPVINELASLTANDHLVLELSSFQLEDLHQSPKGALITNISQNHLDVHHTMENYIQAKENIYLNQGPDDFLILNYDDPLAQAMATKAPSNVFYFSLQTPLEVGAYLKGEDLILALDQKKFIIAKRGDLSLPGEHNVANILAASLFSALIGARKEAIQEVAKSFVGVPHRLEFVAEISGVRYYNDSIATTPERTQAALRSFAKPIILLAGGSDKDLSFTELGPLIQEHCQHVILFGATAEKIKQAVIATGDFPIDQVETLGEALALANDLAKVGDIVLLSPASASFDQYRNFIERGNHFRQLVEKLRKKQEEIK